MIKKSTGNDAISICRLIANACCFAHLPVAPPSAFGEISPVSAHREGQRRGDLSGSPGHRRMAAICAFETLERRLESTLTGHSWSRRGATGAIRDREVLPSQLRSRLSVADKSQRRRDIGKLGRRRKAFERGPDCGLRVCVELS